VTLRGTERTGALVIRAWIESGSFRARVTRSLDVSTRDDVVSVVAAPDEVTRIVVDWLEAFVAQPREGDGAVTPR
jgi:hypothetical protein